MLEIRDLSRQFGEVRAVDGISLGVQPGKFVGIIGRSGAGKSTLLRLINRLTDPTSGAIIAGLTVSGQALAEGWQDQYKTVRSGILSGENEKDRIARYTPFEEYLESEFGVEVEIFTAGSYDGVIQTIAADQIEFAFFGSSSYAAAYTATPRPAASSTGSTRS